jgi:hypothetical protein
VTILAPAEHPWDGSQVVERLAAVAPRRPRAELQQRDLANRTCRLVIGHEVRMLDQSAIDGMRYARQCLHGFMEFRLVAGLLRLPRQAMREHARDQELEMG